MSKIFTQFKDFNNNDIYLNNIVIYNKITFRVLFDERENNFILLNENNEGEYYLLKDVYNDVTII